jgi:hypothetical protein
MVCFKEKEISPSTGAYSSPFEGIMAIPSPITFEEKYVIFYIR